MRYFLHHVAPAVIAFALLTARPTAQPVPPITETEVLPPASLAKVTIGMGKDRALAGLAQNYEIVKRTDSWWLVRQRDTKQQVGELYFENDRVLTVASRSTTGTAADTIAFVSDLLRIARPLTEREDGNDSLGENRKAEAVLRLRTVRIPKLDMEMIFFDFGGGRSIRITLNHMRGPAGEM